MNVSLVIYTILTSTLVILLFPFLWVYTRITGRYRHHLKERLGWIPLSEIRKLQGSPRIWVHAASLGEVRVAQSVVGALRRMMPECSVVVSTMTEHGRRLAEETFGREVPVLYAPIDFVGCVRKSLYAIRPHAMVFLETEIWPAWVFAARRMGIKIALVNGRISVRSIGGYLRLRPFFQKVLECFDVFSMIAGEDGARIRSMGAPVERVQIHGNAKYDLQSTPHKNLQAEMRRILDLGENQKVFLAGSTRQGEEEMVLDAYKRILVHFPDTVLIIVPRHIDRAPAIGALMEKNGLPYQLRTALDGSESRRTEQVILVDTFGELFQFYSVGTIVFCGASLVPLGGQNPLEPAVWGKPVLYGPSMEDFRDAKDLLEACRAGVPVSTPEDLGDKAIWLLEHPQIRKEYGERARQAVRRNKGAAERHARVIQSLLDPKVNHGIGAP